MKGISKFNIILITVAVVTTISASLIPEIGKFALLNEVSLILLMGAVTAILVKALLTIIKFKKVSGFLFGAAVALLIGMVAVSKTINTVKDYIAGPEWITLSECEVERRTGTKGVFSLKYYLKGEDGIGKSYRFILPGKEYESLHGVDSVSVLGYKNTGRIVDIEKVSEKYE